MREPCHMMADAYTLLHDRYSRLLRTRRPMSGCGGFFLSPLAFAFICSCSTLTLTSIILSLKYLDR